MMFGYNHSFSIGLLLVLLLPSVILAVEAPALGDSVMVASAHPLATKAGLHILRQGGNAVDAAVTVAFALAVCEPYSSGLGGGGFAVVYDQKSGRVKTLDCRETAPSTADPDMFLVGHQPDANLSRYSPLAVGVPGLVRGLWQLHQSDGRLPWNQLLQPAIDLADDGFPVSAMLQRRIESRQHNFNTAARAIFLINDTVPAEGQILRQVDLAETLKAIAIQGADVFYKGPIADAIAKTADLNGRGLTAEDLANYQARWRQPIHGTYRQFDVYSMPPPSSGGVHLIQMLNILERYDLRSAGYGSVRYFHLLTEAMKFAYADRSRFLGDTDFVPVPIVRLTSRTYADSLAGLISLGRAKPESEIVGAPLAPSESSETTHLSVVDAAGNAVAATLTINLTFGSGLVAPGTGVLLNDEMDDFVAAPGRPNAFGLVGGDANAIQPGKRPLSSMTPTLVLQDGQVRLVTGAPGGSKIITTTLQTVLHVLDFDMDALQAVSVPRIHHQWFPRVLYHEPYGLGPDVRAALAKMGHHPHQRSPMCNAQLIVVDPLTRQRHGASDPRGMGRAAGF